MCEREKPRKIYQMICNVNNIMWQNNDRGKLAHTITTHILNGWMGHGSEQNMLAYYHLHMRLNEIWDVGEYYAENVFACTLNALIVWHQIENHWQTTAEAATTTTTTLKFHERNIFYDVFSLSFTLCCESEWERVHAIASEWYRTIGIPNKSHATHFNFSFWCSHTDMILQHFLFLLVKKWTNTEVLWLWLSDKNAWLVRAKCNDVTDVVYRAHTCNGHTLLLLLCGMCGRHTVGAYFIA